MAELKPVSQWCFSRMEDPGPETLKRIPSLYITDILLYGKAPCESKNGSTDGSRSVLFLTEYASYEMGFRLPLKLLMSKNVVAVGCTQVIMFEAQSGGCRSYHKLRVGIMPKASIFGNIFTSSRLKVRS
ncbi:hypothetical protein ElyMa_005335400 [Elysia marginata]|uniref:Uncharacterized protein n=1 Tax=Elysia marginata TaxID=1093978 RepID=A0AAV4EAC4_9GAST|nr:hypothetical protein ElyMa_005335400 [Elysia marginata]